LRRLSHPGEGSPEHEMAQLSIASQSKGPSYDNREYGEFLHKKGEFFYDFDEIRKEIIA
jgi:hypothetical protein